jgi:predicted transcriptional regulator
MKTVLDNNHRDMLQFRMEQEQKDQANRRNVESIQKENA